jgi:uncharacterized membrane protein
VKVSGFLLVLVLFSTLCVAGSIRPASADLRFCNQTSADSYIIEGYHTAHDGLTVHGSIHVKKGTCGVIIPGNLAPNSYYLRVVQADRFYGGSVKLCVLDLYDFTLKDEDRPGFKCSGMFLPAGFDMPAVIKGYKNKPYYLAGFMSIASYGYPTMIVTQRKDASVHYELKK